MFLFLVSWRSYGRFTQTIDPRIKGTQRIEPPGAEESSSIHLDTRDVGKPIILRNLSSPLRCSIRGDKSMVWITSVGRYDLCHLPLDTLFEYHPFVLQEGHPALRVTLPKTMKIPKFNSLLLFRHSTDNSRSQGCPQSSRLSRKKDIWSSGSHPPLQLTLIESEVGTKHFTSKDGTSLILVYVCYEINVPFGRHVLTWS